MPSRKTMLFGWAVAYVAVMGGMVAGLFAARHWATSVYGTAEAKADWDAFRRQQRQEQTSGKSPVKRKVSKSTEPPLLVLTRDYFTSILGFSLVIGHVLFLALAAMLRGAMARQSLPHADSSGNRDSQEA